LLNPSTDAQYVEGMIKLVNDIYQGPVTDNELIEGAVKGIMESLDDYSTYFTIEEADSFFGDVSGTFSGIGVTIENRDGSIVIISIIRNTPAEKAGLIPFDVITSVDGKSVSGMSTDEVAKLIKGEAGTSVELGIKRGVNAIKIYKITRETINMNPVTYEVKSNSVGYIKLETFYSNAYSYFSEALTYMDANHVTKIILDLRGNPGGDVAQAVAIARRLLPAGLITKLNFKEEGKEDEEFFSVMVGTKYELAVLVNESSASASEILAGAIQDREVGPLIGVNTYGKAQVQNLIPLLNPEAYLRFKAKTGADIVNAFELIEAYNEDVYNNDLMGWVKITTGVYTTPNGRLIDSEGLTPNIYVKNPEAVNGVYPNQLSKLSENGNYVKDSIAADVYCAEKLLKILGYYVLAPDAYLDIVTYRALRLFQTDKGLPADGVLNVATQKALNMELEKALLKYDLQYRKAMDFLIN
jgi:carboxyl-terminal processing protease